MQQSVTGIFGQGNIPLASGMVCDTLFQLYFDVFVLIVSVIVLNSWFCEDICR